MNFLERVLLTPVSENQLSSIVESFPSMPVISGNETLDAAIQEMMSSGYQDVAAMDGGVLSFILHVDDVFENLRKEGEKMGNRRIRRDSLLVKADETGESGLLVQASEETSEESPAQRKPGGSMTGLAPPTAKGSRSSRR